MKCVSIYRIIVMFKHECVKSCRSDEELFTRTVRNGPERSRTDQNGTERSRTARNGSERLRTARNGSERHRTAQNGPERLRAMIMVIGYDMILQYHIISDDISLTNTNQL